MLDRCLAATDTDRVEILDGRSSAKFEFGLLNWSLPVFKSFSLIFTSQASLHHAGENDMWVDKMHIYLFIPFNWDDTTCVC